MNPVRSGLEQNFPNPFNGITQIRYVLQESAPVLLAVYNIQGQIVRTLVQEFQSPGEYRLDWNGRDASGKQVPGQIYISRLTAGDYTQVKKMVLIQ
ncbi:T9SS type A sorting domain-containing protein [bacterium]|nr:T9SS type A sorting domain-containing protein [bacterium]